MADPSNKYLFAALMVKHAFMWLAVGAGALLWVRMRKVARGMTTESVAVLGASPESARQ